MLQYFIQNHRSIFEGNVVNIVLACGYVTKLTHNLSLQHTSCGKQKTIFPTTTAMRLQAWITFPKNFKVASKE